MDEKTREDLRRFGRGRRFGRAVVAVVVCLLFAARAAGAGSEQATDGLQAQLRALAETEHVRVVGVNRVENVPAPSVAARAPLQQRLDQLLAGYNYLLTTDDAGRPEMVRILGKRVAPAQAPTPLTVTITTTRRGHHHLVPATIVGRNGATARLMLMLDTGASTVVLPQSMAAPLGFTDGTLKDGVARTAAGTITVRLGELSQVRVGQARASDVAVAFVNDATLGEGSLLGMSFLERFDMRLEEGRDRLTLGQR